MYYWLREVSITSGESDAYNKEESWTMRSCLQLWITVHTWKTASVVEISCRIANKHCLNFVEDIFTFLSMYNITCKCAFDGQDELQKTAMILYGENTTIFHDDITKDIKHCFTIPLQ